MGNDYMRDLLQKFSETNYPFVESTKKTAKTEEIELNLGLSLGNSLYRSSSNASTFPRSDVDLSLTRTSSLPSECLEETRKRKGLMEVEVATKKISEKQRAFRYEPIISSLPSSQGSIGSQGSFSSGISEFENQSAQGQNNHNGSRSPASVLSLPEQREHKPIAVPCPKPIKKMDITTESEMESPLVKPKVKISCTRESETKVMEEMPCVFTKGDGPNGKRIDGLLFKYKKGEEVRIVCVCHGTFLSPAEFVKHAGGSDVAHPLRHIVVVPSPSSFL